MVFWISVIVNCLDLDIGLDYFPLVSTYSATALATVSEIFLCRDDLLILARRVFSFPVIRNDTITVGGSLGLAGLAGLGLDFGWLIMGTTLFSVVTSNCIHRGLYTSQEK